MSQYESNLPIPKSFFNSETKEPFTTCMMCNESLADKQYMVEKAIKNYPALGTQEIIFEYAMCLSCAGKMHLELSEESRERIEAYMKEHLQNRVQEQNSNPDFDFQQSLSQCIVAKTDVSHSAEYSIYAMCNGSDMTINGFPYALSGEIQDEIMQLLSAKSLEILDDFIGNHFSGPPEVREILRKRPVLI
ncbi:MAG TPA: hypothetical protein DIS90_09090 [Cytophagales bacterium]|nr:hypothetical protein [Cytophagales bacterium]HCR52794.1 hypothetical protein [Cytophagales bacterium]